MCIRDSDYTITLYFARISTVIRNFAALKQNNASYPLIGLQTMRREMTVL